jgi:hypothetical protein
MILAGPLRDILAAFAEALGCAKLSHHQVSTHICEGVT